MGSGLAFFLLSGYDDNGRQLTSILKHEMMYNMKEIRFTYSQKAKEEDDPRKRTVETAIT